MNFGWPVRAIFLCVRNSGSREKTFTPSPGNIGPRLGIATEFEKLRWGACLHFVASLQRRPW